MPTAGIFGYHQFPQSDDSSSSTSTSDTESGFESSDNTSLQFQSLPYAQLEADEIRRVLNVPVGKWNEPTCRFAIAVHIASHNDTATEHVLSALASARDTRLSRVIALSTLVAPAATSAQSRIHALERLAWLCPRIFFLSVAACAVLQIMEPTQPDPTELPSHHPHDSVKTVSASSRSSDSAQNTASMKDLLSFQLPVMLSQALRMRIPTVLTTTHIVHDKHSFQLMTKFYQGLVTAKLIDNSAGASPAAAMIDPQRPSTNSSHVGTCALSARVQSPLLAWLTSGHGATKSQYCVDCDISRSLQNVTNSLDPYQWAPFQLFGAANLKLGSGSALA